MNPLYQKTHFVLSAPHLRDLPPDEGFEVAFAGRSNAGKSSALNAITGQKSLARTSKTPGRTQQLNFFTIDEQRRFVDLPGYGYAKAPAAIQKTWRATTESYLRQRHSLQGIFLIMDIRHPLTVFDRQMIEWCGFYRRPLHILLTKADKLKRGAAHDALLKTRRALREGGASVSLQLFSATQRLGIDEAHEVLDRWFRLGD
ncbi:MAG: YihA family ribosome biogenesis GTP-binding protein [Deltaproteobacteria bacterium]|nr:YihA family ribosome biogenesis GTP-binding protein [Deltaproteobacteria bacterium]